MMHKRLDTAATTSCSRNPYFPYKLPTMATTQETPAD